MNLPSVAICIPTYNQAPYLEQAVRSAVAQTHPCEIWVSDDASTDETPAVMARLLAEFPQIKHARHKQNLGLPGNPRWLAQQPQAEFIVRLDSDDMLFPDYAAKMLKALMEHPTAGYAHAAVEEIGGNGRRRRLRLLARRAGFQNGEESLRASVLGFRVTANICMFRRAALAEVDYYRIAAQYCDDWDLAVRLADAGWGNVYVNEVLASYRFWETPIRSRRKITEVNGCHQVTAVSLNSAFARRQWNLEPITKLRRRLALGHAKCLRSEYLSPAERNEIKEALCQLGDCAALRWKFRWIHTPLAALFELPAKLGVQARAGIKRALFRQTINR
jgi:hypothetical protein